MEMPSLSASTYASSHFPLAALGAAENQIARGMADRRVDFDVDALKQFKDAFGKQGNQGLSQTGHDMRRIVNQITTEKETKPVSTARIVKVFIADTNDNLPLESRVLYKGDEKLTDLTDQELFFEVPIKELLDTHNAVRAKTQDKKQTEKFGREIFLEPARIRDLKMVVVNVAQF